MEFCGGDGGSISEKKRTRSCRGGRQERGESQMVSNTRMVRVADAYQR
jgi:hypothetical protein